MYTRGYLPPVPCPRCGTLNNRVRETCRFCNCPMENYCSDDSCGTLNPAKARYCKQCGKPTLFLQAEVFDEAVCVRKTEEARTYYATYGDPRRPEEPDPFQKIMRELGISNPYEDCAYDDCEDPEPPLEPDEMPYY